MPQTDQTTAPAAAPAAPTVSVNSISNPTEWAIAQLEFMGDPVTLSNVEFLVGWANKEGGNWHNTAKYNPLNTTEKEPGYTETGTQGNIGSYVSWSQGIQATATTLNGYPSISAALAAGDASEQDKAGAFSSDLYKWSGHGYTSIAPSAIAAATLASLDADYTAASTSVVTGQWYINGKAFAGTPTFVQNFFNGGQQATPPANPKNGDTWWAADANGGTLLWYNGTTWLVATASAINNPSAEGATSPSGGWIDTAASDLGDVVAPLKGIDAVGHFFSDLDSTTLWARVGLFAGGLALALVGLVLFIATTNEGKKVESSAVAAAPLVAE